MVVTTTIKVVTVDMATKVTKVDTTTEATVVTKDTTTKEMGEIKDTTTKDTTTMEMVDMITMEVMMSKMAMVCKEEGRMIALSTLTSDRRAVIVKCQIRMM